MNKIILVVAAVFAMTAFGAENINGIFGVKLGEKLARSEKLGELSALNIKAVKVEPDNAEVLQCVALTDTNDIPLAVMCYMPWSEADAKAKIVDGWSAKYGKPTISGFDTDAKHVDNKIEFDTFAVDGRALSFIRQGGKVVLQCADIGAVTNMLGKIKCEELNSRYYGLGLVGKVVGYGTEKKSSEGKQPLSKEDK